MLTESQIAELRAHLEAARHRIASNATNAASFSRDRDRTRMGRDSIDDSAEEALYGTKLALADRESEQLNAIELALHRLASGEAGICQDCDEPIDFERLKARPMSRLCVPCQQDREQESE